ncbi:FAD binding domain-containing protein [Amycolatopsis jejuensis]|uniref:FAD binding domain-containing protein n=1 Tax=Amycolatopsis jejuensis TaxID=330084 RepID=UPI000526D5B1|nr:FAD binding domain-containing protein [Amycolatopsis jejuensis]
MTIAPELHRPGSLPEALALISDDCPPLAGATWLMRRPLRHAGYVSVGPLLRGSGRRRDARTFGAGLTHTELAAATRDDPDLRVLHQAAAHSANPGVRQRATLGGNLCTRGFPAADLVPALLCLDARVVLNGSELPLADFLAERPPGLLTEVVVPNGNRLSGHARLPLRRAGDYPVAIVSVALTVDDGIVRDARVAVGSVEPVARRWSEVEAQLVGQPVDPAAAVEAARGCRLRGRDGVDAPGWYRERVLPVLLGRAVSCA